MRSQERDITTERKKKGESVVFVVAGTITLQDVTRSCPLVCWFPTNYSDREEVNRKLTLREEEPTHSLDKVELSSVKFRLPNEVKSLKILGIGKVKAAKADNGLLSVVVCEVYSRGDLFHPP